MSKSTKTARVLVCIGAALLLAVTAIAALTDYKGMSVISGTPSGAGGVAVKDNFVRLTDGFADVVVSHDGGTWTPHAASADTDAARGVALTAAIAAASLGDHIQLRPGTFAVAATLDVTVALTIEGSGPQTVLSYAGNVLDYANADKCVLSKLTVLGTVEVNSSESLRIVDCEFDANGEDYCLYVHTASYYLQMTGCVLRDAAIHNFYMTDSMSGRVKIIGCSFLNATQDGLRWVYGTGSGSGESSSANVIQGCTFADNDQHGLYLDAIHDTIVSGNNAERNGIAGIRVLRPIETMITGNGVEYNTQTVNAYRAGIWVSLDAVAGYGFTIGSCTIAENMCQAEWIGIYVYGASVSPYHLLIDGNILHETTGGTSMSPLLFRDLQDEHYALITNNLVRGSSSASPACKIQGATASPPYDAQHINLSGNRWHGCAYGILFTRLTNLTVDGDYFDDCGYGIGLEGASVADVRNCRFNDIATAAFRDLDTSSHVAKHNVGHATENSGTAQIDNGSTTVAVSHGLDETPALADIQITPTSTLGNATEFRVGDPTGSDFDITVDADPGENITFGWSIR